MLPPSRGFLLGQKVAFSENTLQTVAPHAWSCDARSTWVSSKLLSERPRFRVSGFAAPKTSVSERHGGISLSAKQRQLTPWQRFGYTLRENRASLLASAVARAVATILMFPLDTLKTRLQSASSARLSSREAFGAVLAQGRFYNGLGSTLIGQVPYGALTFGTYECYKQLLEDLGLPSRRLRWVLAAVLGDLTGSLWLTPSELIKQRLQNMQGGATAVAESSSAWQVLRQSWQQSGIAGLYRGYSGQVARDVPFRAIQLLLFEDGRERLERRRQRPLTPLENLVMGAYAGSVTAAVTTPLDVIKTRLMTDRTYRHAGEAFWQLLRTQPGALFRGIVPRVTYIAPSSAIFFIVYTFLQRQWGARVAQATRQDLEDSSAHDPHRSWRVCSAPWRLRSAL
jgi:solute carrier family 25 S-adenosylmethionine transporter 26